MTFDPKDYVIDLFADARSSDKQDGKVRDQLRFVRGPLMVNWLEEAGRLPGKSLHVAMAIICARSLQGHRIVTLSNHWTEPFGVSRTAKAKAIDRLAKAGLVNVTQNPGCAPRVLPIGLPMPGAKMTKTKTEE